MKIHAVPSIGKSGLRAEIDGKVFASDVPKSRSESILSVIPAITQAFPPATLVTHLS